MIGKVHPKTAFMLLPGMFLFFVHLSLFREVFANSENHLLAGAATLFFLALWIAVGIISVPQYVFTRYLRWRATLFTAILFLSPVALFSMTTFLFIPDLFRQNTGYNLYAIIGAAMLPIGWMTGVILRLIHSCPLATPRESVRIIFGFGYLIAGVAIQGFVVHRLNAYPAFLVITGTAMIICIVFAVTTFRDLTIRKILLIGLAVGAVTANVLILRHYPAIRRAHWETRQPGWEFNDEADIPGGRLTTLFNASDTFPNIRLMLLKNGQRIAVLPKDFTRYSSGVLPAALQPKGSRLHTMVIGGTLTKFPFNLSELPWVKKVTMLSPARYVTRIGLSASRNKFSLVAENFKIINTPPELFLRQSKKFDLIVILDDPVSNPDFDKLIPLAADKLTSGGALIIPAHLSASPKLKQKLKQLFHSKALLPGGSGLAAFGGTALTSNIKILEERLEKKLEGRWRIIPRGVFPIIYSLKDSPPPPKQPRHAYALPCLGGLSSCGCIVIGLAVIIAGTLIRIFLARKNNSGLFIGSMENGICIAGLFLAAMEPMTIGNEIELYDFGLILAGFGAVGMGYNLWNIKVVRRIIAPMAFIVPLTLISLPGQFNTFIPTLICLSSLCGGAVAGFLASQCTVINSESLLFWRYVGYATAALLFICGYMVLPGPLVISVLILLLRLPLLLSKLAIGK